MKVNKIFSHKIYKNHPTKIKVNNLINNHLYQFKIMKRILKMLIVMNLIKICNNLYLDKMNK